MKITLEQLANARVCETYTDRFAEFFGKSVDVTEDAAEAVASQFPWGSVAYYFLNKENDYRFFCEQKAAYERFVRENEELATAIEKFRYAEEELADAKHELELRESRLDGARLELGEAGEDEKAKERVEGCLHEVAAAREWVAWARHSYTDAETRLGRARDAAEADFMRATARLWARLYNEQQEAELAAAK